MITIYDLKPAFQNLLRPICRWLASRGITANQVTIFALLVSIAVGANLAMNPSSTTALFALPIWLFLRMALNAIDGMLAREHNMQSALGGILNELSDVIADAALYLPFALVAGISTWAIIAIVLLSVLSEMAGVVAVQVGASRRYEGPMGKSDRAFVFGLLALLLGFGVDLGNFLTPALWVIALLTVATVWNRCRKALLELDPPNDN
ncbi:MAG: CDP-alcohol phosphatidyltransferase family protein [Pseudomonadota bacterium]